MVVPVSAVLAVAQTRDRMMALRFVLLLPAACAGLLFRRPDHAGQRMQFQDQEGLSAGQVDAGWEAPVSPLRRDLLAEPEKLRDRGDLVDVADFSDQSKAEQNGSGASGNAEHQEQGLAPAAPDDVHAIQQVAPKKPKGRAGRKRKAWTEHESVQKTEKLRKAALSWLKDHNKVHTVLTSSTWCGKRTYLAKCSRCLDCSLEWCSS